MANAIEQTKKIGELGKHKNDIYTVNKVKVLYSYINIMQKNEQTTHTTAAS